MSTENLGAILKQLSETIESRRGANVKDSYTASLLAGGPARCAKKFGEEAVEAAIAGAARDKNALTEEAADVLYHLLVLMASAGVETKDVAAALQRRSGKSGHEEKSSRS